MLKRNFCGFLGVIGYRVLDDDDLNVTAEAPSVSLLWSQVLWLDSCCSRFFPPRLDSDSAASSVLVGIAGLYVYC